MKRFFALCALLALVAIPAIGCGPGEVEIPEDPAPAPAEEMNADNNSAVMEIDESETGK